VRTEGDNDVFDLDGFEVINLKSHESFLEGTSIETSEQCRPRVAVPLPDAFGWRTQPGNGDKRRSRQYSRFTPATCLAAAE